MMMRSFSPAMERCATPRPAACLRCVRVIYGTEEGERGIAVAVAVVLLGGEAAHDNQ